MNKNKTIMLMEIDKKVNDGVVKNNLPGWVHDLKPAKLYLLYKVPKEKAKEWIEAGEVGD